MIRKTFKVILISLAVILLVFFIFFLILYYNQDRMKSAMISEINTHLNVPVDISSIEISIKKFPDASFLFTDVYSSGANAESGDTLLFAKEVFLQFNIWEVLSSSISISKISVENGVLNIRQSRASGNNFEIWKKDSTAQKSSLFALEKLVLRDLQCSYYYLYDTEIEAFLYLNNADLRGNFDDKGYDIHTAAYFHWDSLLIDRQLYLTDLATRTEFDLLSTDADIFLKNASLTLDDEVELNYGLVYNPDKLLIEARGENIDLEEALKISSEQDWFIPEAGLTAGGEVSATFKYSSDNQSPGHLEIGFITENAFLSNKTARISNIALNGKYLVKENTDKLSITGFSGKGKTGKINGNLQMTDLSSPVIKFSLISDLDLQEWLVIFPQSDIVNASGKVNLDFTFENHFSDLENIRKKDLRSAKASGSLILNNISIDLGNEKPTIGDLNGSLQFSKTDLVVERLYFKNGKSDIYLQGRFENIFNYLLLENENLKINARLKSQSIDLEDFLFTSGKKKEQSESSKGNIDLNLIMEADKVRYKTFYATAVEGNLSWINDVLTVDKFNLKSDGGSFEGNFEIDTRPEQKNNLIAALQVEGVNIHDLFISFNNFSQSAVSAENIYGTGSADIKLQSSFTKEMEVILPSINLQAHLKILNGNLKNYEPLTALSDFAEISELKDVKFSSLENDISIKNQNIIIPAMEIKSNVTNLEIYGTHSFENEINYHLKVKLKDVFFKKRKRKPGNSEFDDYIFEEKTDDDAKVPILISGTVDNPLISLDNKNLGKSISEELKEQGKEIKNIFKKEDPKPQKGTGIKYQWEEDDEG